MTKTRIATPDEANRRKKNKPKLRDGVMKRGNTWSYVIRVKDPETGVSKPRWVGGLLPRKTPKKPATKHASKLGEASTSIEAA